MEQMELSKDQRITLTIPYPSKMPRGRGINAVDKYSGQLKLDCTSAELEEITQAAVNIGITRSMFIRSCAVRCAKEVNRAYVDPEPASS